MSKLQVAEVTVWIGKLRAAASRRPTASGADRFVAGGNQRMTPVSSR